MESSKSSGHFPCGNYDKVHMDEARKNNGILNCDIELSKRCNIHCNYCYSASGKPLENELTLEEIKKVITDAKELGARTVTINGGEPTIHPHFSEIVQFIHSKGMLTQLFTNAIAITKKSAETLFENEVYPCVSIESLNPSVHDKLTEVPGSLEKTLQGIENLIEAGYTKEKSLAINAVITKTNYNDLEELWKWAVRKGIQPTLIRVIPTGRGHVDMAVSTKQIKSIVEKIAVESGYDPTIPYCADSGCRKHYMSCFVNAQGFVQLCSCIHATLGNIRFKDLRTILRESSIFRTMRNLDNELIGECSTCDYKSNCYGCRALAYAVTGNMFESDPHCWHVA